VSAPRLVLESFPQPGKARVALRFLHVDGEALTELQEINPASSPQRAALVQELRPDLQAEAKTMLDALAVDLLRSRAAGGTKPESAEGGASVQVLEELEPWPEPVELNGLLDGVVSRIRTHLAMTEHDAVAMALWCVHAHAHAGAQVSPILAFVSPEKRCGKSTALTITAGLSPRPLPASNITAAAVFRAVEKLRPTLLIDEADTFIGENEGLRGVLNSGHTRSMASVVRLVGDNYDIGKFSTWSPKAIAMIGELPSTLADRAVTVRLRRKQAEDPVAPLRLDRLSGLRTYARQLARWAQDNMETLETADPTVPAGLNDRAADNWRPLLAIADLAGTAWAQRARTAARALAGAEPDASPGVLLLEDLRQLFREGDAEKLGSKYLISRLIDREDRPWPEWRNGHPLTPRAMARLLKPFGVEPMQWRVGPDVTRGYAAEAFVEAWARYVTDGSVTASGLSVHGNQLAHNDLAPAVTDASLRQGSAREMISREAA
jgi:putative DNA primase/helicase